MSASSIAAWAATERLLVKNRAGLQVDLLANGTIGAVTRGPMQINQIRGVLPEGAPFRLWLRSGRQLVSLLNPAHVTTFAPVKGQQAVWHGQHGQWQWRILLELDSFRTAWTWHVEVTWNGTASRRVEAILAQDVGLATLQHIRINEAYNSQYIDHTVLTHPQWGPVLCARQNLPQGDWHPWLAAFCPTGAAAFATDGLDVFGLVQRTTGHPLVGNGQDLPSRRRQGESACAALQSQPANLAKGQRAFFQFRLMYHPDHPAASSAEDLNALSPPPPLRWPRERKSRPAARSVWDEPALLHGRPFQPADWDRWFPRRRHEEKIGRRLASFFTPDGRHVVARAKEERVERSHGHLLLGSQGRLPDSEAMGTTVYASGVFNAHVFCGNPDFSRVLTVIRDPLQRLRASGQRVWVHVDGAWHLLGTPSVFAMGPDSAEWWYRLSGRLLRVVCRATVNPSAILLECAVVQGRSLRWRITHQLCLGTNELDQGGRISLHPARGQVVLTPDPGSMDAQRNPRRRYRLSFTPAAAVTHLGQDRALWQDGQSRQAPFVVAETRAVRHVAVRIQTTAAKPAAHKKSQDGAPSSPWQIARGPAEWTPLTEILPWFRHDAWIHLAAPHGLEQYGGGAWGVRDVCQGPVEWLLGEQRYAEVREILRIVFAHQYADTGLWPQWFMLGRYADIHQRHCHGDIMFWPVKALCDYAEAANDPGILDLEVPFLAPDGSAVRPRPLLEHVEWMIRNYQDRCVGDTGLIAYGDGDWDDTLQPAQPGMRAAMVSAWTVQLAYQTFTQLQDLLERANVSKLAGRVQDLRYRIFSDFHRYLMPDGIVAGFGLWRGDDFEPLLHPRDQRSGIQYRLLPMTRGILSYLFDFAQAMAHRGLIRQHLRFPDGVRLMNRPVAYAGGVSRLFQRAETAAYFGREVSLMYVHAHLRYAEAMARLGDADEAWWALQIVNPVLLSQRLPHAAPRQANVYFSSSDGDFADRHEAAARFDDLRSGRCTVKSGWRLYSSGPGLYLHKIRASLFGIREQYDRLTLNPVLPRQLLPCQVHWQTEGKQVRLEYYLRRGAPLLINGQAPTTLDSSDNLFSQHGVSVDRQEFQRMLDQKVNRVQIAAGLPAWRFG